MREADWVDSIHPYRMLNQLKFLRPPSSARKCRLLAVGCCRRIWDLLVDPRSRSAVEVLERFTAGEAWMDELEAYARVAQHVPWDYPQIGSLNHAAEAVGMAVVWDLSRASRGELVESPLAVADPHLITRVAGAAYHAAHARGASLHPGGSGGAWDRSIRIEESAQAELIREIFGNVYRPIDRDPPWLTPGVLDLARAIERSRDFDGMPALGDALEESGCDSVEILDHCRRPAIHAPGCWVLDAVLVHSIRPIGGA